MWGQPPKLAGEAKSKGLSAERSSIFSASLVAFHPTSDNSLMSGNPAVSPAELMRAEKRTAAGNSVWAAVVITGLKLFVGVTTGSLGILSEAAHSGLDLIA